MRARKITPLLTLSCTAVRLCLLACPHCERTLCEQAPRDASARRVCILVDPAPPFRFASRFTLGHPRAAGAGAAKHTRVRARQRPTSTAPSTAPGPAVLAPQWQEEAGWRRSAWRPGEFVDSRTSGTPLHCENAVCADSYGNHDAEHHQHDAGIRHRWRERRSNGVGLPATTPWRCRGGRALHDLCAQVSYRDDRREHRLAALPPAVCTSSSAPSDCLSPAQSRESCAHQGALVRLRPGYFGKARPAPR